MVNLIGLTMTPIKNNKIEVVPLRKIEKFILDSNEDTKDEVFAILFKLSELPHPRPLRELVDSENRIFEARGETNDVWIRLFWFWHKGLKGRNVIVVVHVYLKKQNRIDRKEVKIAVSDKKRFLMNEKLKSNAK